ncbi:MAG: nitrilase-related carbon-nitrogen hydrolase, partial [Desulfobacterales bacterium]
NQAKVGFLICSELWFNQHARDYARQGVHLLVCPRATPKASVEKWIAGGRTAAVVSGAYCLSSNFSGARANGPDWGGAGWIVEPEEGAILGLTSEKHPFITLKIDLQAAEKAKGTYPRYVRS